MPPSQTRALVVDGRIDLSGVWSPEVLSGIAGVAVVGTASNGKMALFADHGANSRTWSRSILRCRKMNGIEVLEAMRKAGQGRQLSSSSVPGRFVEAR